MRVCSPNASPLPIWDILIPILLALMITDVAIRRIAWDWTSTKRMATNARDYVMSFTTTRKVETRQSIDCAEARAHRSRTKAGGRCCP